MADAADAAEAETEAESEEGDPPLHSMRPIEDTDVAAETEVADTKIEETEEVKEPSVAPTQNNTQVLFPTLNGMILLI